MNMVLLVIGGKGSIECCFGMHNLSFNKGHSRL